MKDASAKIIALAIMALMLAIIGHGQSGPGKLASGPSTIRGEGCVEAGVEAGCLMVTDRETDILYNVFFPSGDKPAIGQRIYFTGNLREGTNMCMQGRPVNVQQWVPRKMTCSAPEKKRNPY